MDAMENIRELDQTLGTLLELAGVELANPAFTEVIIFSSALCKHLESKNFHKAASSAALFASQYIEKFQSEQQIEAQK